MKYFYFLLLCFSLCNVQHKFDNYTKVIAYRLIDTPDDGPCNVLHYFNEFGIGNFLQAIESYDSTMAYKFIELKKVAQEKWKKRGYNCKRGSLGGSMVPNMFIVEINKYRDTIFTTEGNTSIFLPKEQTQYIDTDGAVNASFTNEFTNFFRRDFHKEFNTHHNDSIPNTAISVKGKPVYSLNRKRFEKEIGKFQTITTDSISGYSPEVDKSYKMGRTTYYFNQNYGLLKSIEIEIPYFDLEDDYPDNYKVIIDGISTGSPQEMLFKKYPNSTKYRNNGARAGDINNNYHYNVELNNNTGDVTYYIKDKTINRIRIEFNYPE